MPFTAATQPNSTDGEYAGTHECLTLAERQEREAWKAKLRQRVQFQQIARNLRAKLQYAAYKVRHNVTHLTLEELEARQAAAATRVPNASTEGAAFSTAKRNPPDLQSRSSIVPSTLVRASARPSSLGRPPQSGTEGTNAMQSLYASILAQSPSRPARTMHNTNNQTASNSQRRVTSRTHQNRRGNGDSLIAYGSNSPQAIASGSSSKRKCPATASRTKASKRKHGDDAAVASRDDDEDLQAAATLTHLFRSSLSGSKTKTMQSSVVQSSHILHHNDNVPCHSQPSLGFQLRRALAEHVIVIPGHDSPLIPPRVDALPTQHKTHAGSSAQTSTISCTRHPTAARSTSTRVADNEAVQLLYYLHGHPKDARAQASVRAHKSDVLNSDAASSEETLDGEEVTPAFDVQANRRAVSMSYGGGSAAGSAPNGSAPASFTPAYTGSTGAGRSDPNVHHRQSTQKRTAIADTPPPVRDPEVLPLVYVTPPSPLQNGGK